MNIKKLNDLITKNESEILEFKVDNEDPERIGKYVSALPLYGIIKIIKQRRNDGV